jgi:hypothetical protein
MTPRKYIASGIRKINLKGNISLKPKSSTLGCNPLKFYFKNDDTSQS